MRADDRCRAGAGRDHRGRIMKGTDMTSTQRVWISPQACERLHRELATLRELCTARSQTVIPTKRSPLSNKGGRHGFTDS